MFGLIFEWVCDDGFVNKFISFNFIIYVSVVIEFIVCELN